MSDEVSCSVALIEIPSRILMQINYVNLLLSKIACTSKILCEIIGLSTVPVKCKLTVTPACNLNNVLSLVLNLIVEAQNNLSILLSEF